MIDNPTADLTPPGTKVALSWADIVLIALLLAAGMEAWRAAGQLAGSLAGPEPHVEPTLAQAVADHEQRVQRAQDDVAALRAAFIDQQLGVARERATLASLEQSHPGLDRASSNGASTVPETRRTAYAEAQLNLSVGNAMLTTIRSEMDRVEAEHAKHVTSLRAAQRARDAAVASAKEAFSRRHRGLTLILSAGATGAVLLLAWLFLQRPASANATRLVHTGRVMGIAAVGLAIIGAHLALGAVGSLIFILVFAAFVLARPKPSLPRRAMR